MRRNDCEYEAKVDVFEDRVQTWFLEWAAHLVHTDLVDDGVSSADYVALSVALAYIDGMERYLRGGDPPGGKNGEWFKASAKRITAASDPAIDMLWESARCGLLHSGFTEDRVYLSHVNYSEGLEKTGDGELHINPARFVQLIVKDFEAYVQKLRANPSGKEAQQFKKLWDERWESP